MDDTSIQFTWRSLREGTLVLRTAQSEARSDLTAERALAGAITITGLAPDVDHRVAITGDAVARPDEVTVRTAARLPGDRGASVATLSDLHLGTTSFGHLGTITEDQPVSPHPERCARAALDEAVAWGAQRMVVKGDMTESGGRHQWRSYADLVAHCRVPVDALPGNHDRAGGSDRSSLQPEDAAVVHGLSMAAPMLVRDLPALRMILLDSTRTGRHGGGVEDLTEAVLDAVRETRRQGNVLILTHHQLDPLTRSEGWPPGVNRAEAARFLRRVGAEHPRVLVTSGHTHRHRRRTLGGAISTQVGSTKDYPGVWAGYTAHEGGLRQIVRRIERPDCITWTETTRRAALGTWRWIAPGRLANRCFDLTTPTPLDEVGHANS